MRVEYLLLVDLTMEHITIKELEGGLIRLTPDNGYVIEHTPSHRTYDVVEDDVDNISKYRAVSK